MGRKVGRWRLLVNIGFVMAVLGLAGFGVGRVASREGRAQKTFSVRAALGVMTGFGVGQVARRQWRTQKTFSVRAEFGVINGLDVGDRVRVQGIDAGVVEAVAPPRVPGQPVTLVFRIDERLRPLVRSNAVARIVSEGVVGAKVVEIVPGRPDAPPVAPGGAIATEQPTEMVDLLRQASASLRRVDAVAAAAERSLGDVQAVAASIRRGEGSLGRLVHDDEAY